MADVAAGGSGYLSGTGGGLLAFLKRLGERGEINGSTADNLRRAAGKVLELEGDVEEIDVRNLDVDNILDRFETLHRLDYNAGSMQAYKSRFRQAVALYKAFLAGDPDWKTSVKRESPSKTQASRPATKKAVKVLRDYPPKGTAPAASPAQNQEATTSTAHADGLPLGPRLVTYDLPLRPDLIIRLNLPVDLTEADAERLAAFVRSLAFVPTPSAAAVAPTREDQ